MTSHSSMLAWGIRMDRGTQGLQPMGLKRVGHDWATTRISVLCSMSLQLILYSVAFTFFFFGCRSSSVWAQGPFPNRTVCFSCGAQALQHGLRRQGACSLVVAHGLRLPCSLWDLCSRPGVEPLDHQEVSGLYLLILCLSFSFLSIVPSKSVHVAENGNISFFFFFMAEQYLIEYTKITDFCMGNKMERRYPNQHQKRYRKREVPKPIAPIRKSECDG